MKYVTLLKFFAWIVWITNGKQQLQENKEKHALPHPTIPFKFLKRPHYCEHCFGHIVPSHNVSSSGNVKCAIHQLACLVIWNIVPWNMICYENIVFSRAPFRQLEIVAICLDNPHKPRLMLNHLELGLFHFISVDWRLSFIWNHPQMMRFPCSFELHEL